MLACWLEKPTITYVSEELELPTKLVKQVRDSGVPELDLKPFPPSQAVREGKKRPARPKDEEDKPDDGNGQYEALRLLTHEEVQQHIEAAKKKLISFSTRAIELGQEADLAEAKEEIDGTLATLDETERQLDVEEKRLANVEQRAIVSDNVRKSAEEAAVARQQMNMCINMGAIFSHFIDTMMVAIERGDMPLPAVLDPRMLSTIVSSLERLTAATERAVKIDKGRAGEQENKLGALIGMMLDGCTDEELILVGKTGAIPKRLRAVSSDSDVIDVEGEEEEVN
jgi:hypothetical protein